MFVCVRHGGKWKGEKGVLPCLDASLPPGGAWCARAGLTYLQRGGDDLLRESDDNCASGITPAWKKQSQQVSNGFSTRESYRPLEVTGSAEAWNSSPEVCPCLRPFDAPLALKVLPGLPAPSHEQTWDHSPPRPRRHQQETEERLNPNVESVSVCNVDVFRPAATSTTPRRQHRRRYANVPCAVPSGNRRSTSCGSCLSSAHRFRHMSVCFGLERAGGGEGGNGRARQGACRWSATSFPVCSFAIVGGPPLSGPVLASGRRSP